MPYETEQERSIAIAFIAWFGAVGFVLIVFVVMIVVAGVRYFLN